MTTRQRGLRPVIMDFFEKHPGEVIHISRLAKATEFSHQTLSAAVGKMLDVEPGLERKGMGAWVYNPPTTSIPAIDDGGGRLFEQIAELKDGQLLLRCEKGMLCTASPVKSRLTQ